MEMQAKQDYGHCCLWAHHLLEKIIASAQRICSISSKAAVRFCFFRLDSTNTQQQQW